MQFDVVIIGGGLSGLSCGIRLLQQGKRCALVSTGQNALHFSSGSFDLLNSLPDGSLVKHPAESLAELAKQAPNHPYSILGAQTTVKLFAEAEQLLQESGIPLHGSYQQNHFRLTPFGFHKPTWLSSVEVPRWPIDQPLPWQKLAVISIDGFLDFQPELAADALRQQGVTVETAYLRVPTLDRLRSNPSEFRAINISRILDLPENLALLANDIAELSGDAEAVILPACVGLDNALLINTLTDKVGKPVMLVPTLPPSLMGIRVHQLLSRRFQKMGGVFMPGDTVLRAEMEDHRVNAVYSHNHTDIPLKAEHFVLASGSFFSNGLIAEFNGIREPVFGLDIASSNHRSDWSRQNLFEAQPYLQYGVETDAALRGLKNGQPVKNLYVSGAVLSGYDPLRQGCGAGVALVSALHIADSIINYKGGAL
jgi:glycerol-3-phosphate dehydrogenase subunit B